MMITLQHHPLCPASRAVRLACLESGLEPAFSEVKPWALTVDFLNINPAGTLPVLSIEGKNLCGAYSIVEYLSETAKREASSSARAAIWTGTPSERAEQRRVAEWFLLKFDAEVAQSILEEKFYKPMSRGRLAPDLSIIRAGRSNLRYHLSYVSFLSDQRKWLGGDQISFADLAASAQISVMDYLDEMPWGDFPEVKAWYQRLKSRPSFRPMLAERIPGINPPEHYANLDF